MFGKLSKKLTNNYEEVPLLWVMFNLNKYQKEGEKGSCDLRLHPTLKDDPFIKEQLNGLVDHIRANYDMEKLSK
jgi:hypothetical protein